MVILLADGALYGQVSDARTRTIDWNQEHVGDVLERTAAMGRRVQAEAKGAIAR